MYYRKHCVSGASRFTERLNTILGNILKSSKLSADRD